MMRTFVKAILGVCLVFVALAADASGGDQSTGGPNIITETTPFKPEDQFKVIVFFKFSCPVCRSYHMVLEHWSRTLPKQIGFEFYPVLEGDGNGHEVSDESARGSMYFWAVEYAGTPEQRALFAENAYSVSQDSHEESDVSAWKKAVLDAGVDKFKFSAAWNTERTVWATRAQRQIHYQPTGTPTMVICGKQMITPDSTNGDQNMFMQLANGLVSQCMRENGIPVGQPARR